MRPILVVVGEPGLRHRLTEILSSAGHEVVEVESGESALELAPSLLPSVILIAIVMPQLNGLETAARLRRLLGSKVAIILLGSLPPIGIDEEPLASLIDGYLSMDAPAKEVLACVSSKQAEKH